MAQLADSGWGAAARLEVGWRMTAMAGAGDAAEAALRECDSNIAWYEAHGRPNRRWFQLSQIVTVVAGVVAPFFAAGVGVEVPPLIRAVPSALAALSYGLNSVLHWGENWRRFATTAQALKSARLSFTTAYASAPGERRAAILKEFVDEINRLVGAETDQWGAQLDASAPSRTVARRRGQ
jgi:hypothetical protein